MALQAVSNFIPGGFRADTTNFLTPVFDVTLDGTTIDFAIGTEVEMYNTTTATRDRFSYHRGVASVIATDAVIIKHGDNAGILLDDAGALTSELGMVGFAMAATVAAQYGWFQIYGRATANVAASFAADLGVFATTLAGTVDDAAGGGQIMNARSESAIDTPSTGSAYIDIWYPFIPGTAGTWV